MQTDPSAAPQPSRGELFTLARHFDEFRAMLVRTTSQAGIADAAQPVFDGLDAWAVCMVSAEEAAARAPETDRFLARMWSDRLTQVALDARRALAALPGVVAAVSIAGHEDTGIPLPGIPKPAPQPAARAARHRASRARRRRG